MNAVALFAVLLTTAAVTDAAVTPPVPLFTHGDAGYPCIRSPTVVRTNQSLLAFAGTRCGAGDGCYPHARSSASHMDLVMRRSRDNGRTWSPLRVLYRASCADRDHGTPVYDAPRGRVVIVLRGDGVDTWTIRSDDDGDTWSDPERVPLGKYDTSRPAPGVGLQLRADSPVAPGRLVFVAQVGVRGGASDVVYFSDDGGRTFNVSATEVPGGNEAQIVELSNGTLLMNARYEVGPKAQKRHRLFATSDDAGVTWGHVRLRTDLDATSCAGGFLAVEEGDRGGKQTLLYSHPAAYTGRTDGTVWASTDEGATFSPLVKVTPGNASVGFAYSCLTPTHAAGTAGLAYETGADGCDGPSCRIMYTAFPWMSR